MVWIAGIKKDLTNYLKYFEILKISYIFASNYK